jgi:hypothetical protein
MWEYESIYDVHDDDLMHWGIKGMKWGIRRYQNKDGSLTAAGKKRRSLGQVIHDRKVHKKRVAAAAKARETREKNLKAEAKRKKALEKGTLSVKKMTDDELAASIKRLENEQKYAQKVLETSTMKRFMHKSLNEAIIPGITEGGKQLVKDFMIKKGSKALGLNEEKAKSALDILKEESMKSTYRKTIDQNNKYFEEERTKAKEAAETKAKEEAQKKVDEYNAQLEKDRWQDEGRHNMKGDGTSKSIDTDIPGTPVNDKSGSSTKSESKPNNNSTPKPSKEATQTVKTSGSTTLSTLSSGSGKKDVEEGEAGVQDMETGELLVPTIYREEDR